MALSLNLIFSATVAATFILSTASGQIHWDNLYVKWSSNGLSAHINDEAYFRMPLTVTEALKMGYVIGLVEEYTVAFCLPDDPRVCMMYDFHGSVAGILIGWPVEDVYEGAPCNNSKYLKFQCGTIFDRELYIGRFYFVNPTMLQNGGRSSSHPIGEGIWVLEDGTIIQVPMNSSALNATGRWTREGCMDQMGLHYYYNITQYTTCDQFPSFLLLLNNFSEQVFGFAVQTFGNVTSERRQWFESPSAQDMRHMAPTAPSCLESYTNRYGVISLHVYFTCSPWDITC